MSTKRKVKFRSLLVINQGTEGEMIENKVERVVNNKEPIKDGAPIIFTPRQEGVKPAYNIRTDRFEVAIDAMDKVSKSYKARREEKADMRVNKDGEPEPIQGKELGNSTDKTNEVK
jgi:hypothetical protein